MRSDSIPLAKNREFQVLRIGTLTFGAALWDFRPDARVLGAKILATKNWKNVSLDLKLGLLAEGVAMQQVEGTAVVKSGAFSVNVVGTAKPQVQEVNLALSLDYTGVIDSGTFNVGIGAAYQDQKGSGTLGASYKLEARRSDWRPTSVLQTVEGCSTADCSRWLWTSDQLWSSAS